MAQILLLHLCFVVSCNHLYLIILPINTLITESTKVLPTHIIAMPVQNGVGNMLIINEVWLKNHELFLKNKECNQLNSELKSIIAQTPSITIARIKIPPVQQSVRPNALLPHKTNNKIKNPIPATLQMPKAIRAFARKDFTSIK